jgi:hypothetical protein
MPGRSYSGEITRAIQKSRAFVLIFSEHSNNSEQELRGVQLAANSRLHIVQFRIDAVTPSDDLEYYLSGPHWLDAVTPPLENHLEQLKSSMKALLALPHAEAGEVAQRPPPPPSPTAQAQPPSFVRPASTNIWKWVALAGAAVAAIGCVVVIAAVVIVRSKIPSPLPQTSQSTPAPHRRDFPAGNVRRAAVQKRDVKQGRSRTLREGFQSRYGTRRSSGRRRQSGRHNRLLRVWT